MVGMSREGGIQKHGKIGFEIGLAGAGPAVELTTI